MQRPTVVRALPPSSDVFKYIEYLEKKNKLALNVLESVQEYLESVPGSEDVVILIRELSGKD